MIVRVADGQQIDVDDQRYYQLTASIGPQIEQIRMGDSRLMGRDATELTSFVVGQLAYTETTIYQRQYQPTQAERFVPRTAEAGEAAQVVRYRIQDMVGIGKRLSGYDSDIPLVDVSYAEKTFPIVNGGVGYRFTNEELRRSVYLNQNISDARQTAAMEAWRRHMNNVGLFGETASGMTGLYNNANVPQGNAANGLWTTTNAGNPDLVRADINSLLLSIQTATQFNDLPDTLLLPPTRYAYLLSTRLGPNSDKTVLEFIGENNLVKQMTGNDLNIQPGYGLDTAGAGGTARMVAYVNDEQHLIQHVPMPLRFLMPQIRGYNTDVPGEYKYSGVEVRYVKSMAYIDGI